jgi:MYXO-CTERM domain-containing protein
MRGEEMDTFRVLCGVMALLVLGLIVMRRRKSAD